METNVLSKAFLTWNFFNPTSCPQPQSADKTESMELRSQSYKETNANQKDTEGITREPHVDELNKTSGKETEISHDKVPSRTKHSDQKETTNIRKGEPNDTQDKADDDTEVTSVFCSCLTSSLVSSIPPSFNNTRTKSSWTRTQLSHGQS